MSTLPDVAPPPVEAANDGEPSEQELVDYLVTATTEQDVLFVVYWLRRLKERGRLWRTDGRCSVIEAKHSWRNQSALEALTSHSRTTLREFILFLFFFNLETVSFKGKIVLDVEVEQEWAKKVVGKWEYKWRGASLRALDLLRMSDDDEAANWIDANLPPSPNPHLLTGYNPLPPPPLQAVKAEPSPAPPSLSPPATAAVLGPTPTLADGPLPSSLRPKSPSPSPSFPPSAPLTSVNASPPPPQLAASDTPSRLPLLRKSPSKSQPCRIPLPSSAGLGADHPIRLHLFNLPSSTNKNDLRNVLASIQVSCLAIDLVRENNNEFSHAYVTVPNRAAWERADRLLPTATVRGRLPLVERLHPSRKERGIPSHPTVYIDGLLPRTSRFEVGNIMRKARCGAYEAEVTSDGRQGRARASSPDTADRMVRMLDGLEVGRGSRIKASWVGEDGRRHGPGEETVEEKEKDGKEEEEGRSPCASTSRLDDAPPSSTSPLPVSNSRPRPRSPSPSASPSRRRSIYPFPEPSPAPPQKRPRLTPPPPPPPKPATFLSASYSHPPLPPPPISPRAAGLEALKRRTSDPHPSLPGRPRPRSPSPSRHASSFHLRNHDDRWARPPPRRPSPPPPSSRRPREDDRPRRPPGLSASYSHPPRPCDRKEERRRDDDRFAPTQRRMSDPRPRHRSPSPFFPSENPHAPPRSRPLSERVGRPLPLGTQKWEDGVKKAGRGGLGGEMRRGGRR